MHIVLNDRLSVFAANRTKCSIEHADTGMYMHTKCKKHVNPCGNPLVLVKCSVGNLLAVFALHLLER